MGKRVGSVAMAAALATVLSANAKPGEGAVEPSSPCEAWQVEYDLASNLTLSNTPHGAGDGTFRVGPGKAVLLFEGPDVQLLGYTMREQFTIHPSSPFGSADIDVDLTTRSAEGCGVAHGTLVGHTLRWTTRIRDYRSDGTTTCAGGLCGRFGAPKDGENPWRLLPQDVPFGDFTFSPDMTTFTMPSTFVETSRDPQQTAHVALAGREARRTCMPPSTCR